MSKQRVVVYGTYSRLQNNVAGWQRYYYFTMCLGSGQKYKLPSHFLNVGNSSASHHNLLCIVCILVTKCRVSSTFKTFSLLTQIKQIKAIRDWDHQTAYKLIYDTLVSISCMQGLAWSTISSSSQSHILVPLLHDEMSLLFLMSVFWLLELTNLSVISMEYNTSETRKNVFPEILQV